MENFSKMTFSTLSRNPIFSFLGCFFSFFIVLLIFSQHLNAITPPEIRGQSEEQISENMHGADLIGYEFVKADLRGFDFSEADLRGAVFNNSQLQGANLQGAQMEEVVAFATIFEGADLRDANLTNALLMESTFLETDISGADFTNAVLNKSEQNSLCLRAEGINSLTGVSTSESLVCRN